MWPPGAALLSMRGDNGGGGRGSLTPSQPSALELLLHSIGRNKTKFFPQDEIKPKLYLYPPTGESYSEVVCSQ